jgi:iron complex outermembrane receptor protein
MSVFQKSVRIDFRRFGQLGWRAGLMSSVALALVAVPSLAWAQDTGRPAAAAAAGTQDQEADEGEEDASELDDVVVTGTAIRGVAPVGSATVGISQEDIVQAPRGWRKS